MVPGRMSAARRLGVIVAAAVALAAGVGAPAPAYAQISVSRISGTVTDEAGAPISGAVVSANSEAAAGVQLSATSNQKGEFAILGLRRGLWTIVVTAPGFEPTEANLPIRTGANIPRIRVTLRRARAAGARSRLGEVDVEALQAELEKAEALAADGRIDDALAIYRKAVEAVPALTSIHREIGDLCLRQKDRIHALQAYQRLLDADPDDEQAVTAVAGLALELGLEAEAAGEREAAVGYLEQALAAAPDGPRAPETRAALARLKRA